MTYKEKTAFRRKKEWIAFTKVIREKYDYTCNLCGQQLKGKSARRLRVHHKKESDYTNLDESLFALLCAACHDHVHRFNRLLPRNDFVIHQKSLIEEYFKWPSIISSKKK